MRANLYHGGQLQRAAASYGIARERWLDLSTGISPFVYPIPSLPQAVWQRLPEEEDGLLTAAADYYGSRDLLVVAGSQAVIQRLPELIGAARLLRVALLSPGYYEYAVAWQRAGHEIIEVAAAEAVSLIGAQLPRLDVVVVVNPNNPSATTIPAAILWQWQQQLQQQGGWLVVDEAYMDATPEGSLLAAGPAAVANLLLLRSLGKFFGLAGLRLGFLHASAALRQRAAALLGPWAVSHPSRFVATAALQDRPWQQWQRQRLAEATQRLQQLLVETIGAGQATPLFHWLPRNDASALHQFLAQRAILTRLFDQPAGLRIGLPATEVEWQRLTQALADYA
ncbi:MAG: threonine-phosphate decarboxylase [Gammaproteobacteria bacterium]|nr:threonine-phosphate decarboxylase [Gammaproteobacteria bacterium]